MADACLIWHCGGNVLNNIYKGGDVFNQIVDIDKLGYWCLLHHAKIELKQNELLNLYSRNSYNGDLV